MNKPKIIVLSIVVFGIVTVNSFTMQEIFYHSEFRETQTSVSFGVSTAYAYPPAVGILGSAQNCMSCHVSNGPWTDDDKTIIDILDKDTKTSLKRPDGSFLIEAKKGEQKTVLTVIGREKDHSVAAPYRNAWLYIDPSTIGTASLSKFAPGWDVNLPMSCRIVGDNLPGYEDADITSLPMTIQPLDNAKNADMQLQVMLTKGESVKGNAPEGMLGNYFEKKVKLVVK